MAQININVSEVQPSSFEPLPEGKYPVMITESTVETAKSGSNYLKLRLEVIEGNRRGAVLFTNLNLWNANPKAAQIAAEELKAICDAVGHPGTVQDSAELHSKPLMARVRIRTDPGYDAQNEIKGFSAYSAGGAAAPATQAPAPAQRPPAENVPQQAAHAPPASSPAAAPDWTKPGF